MGGYVMGACGGVNTTSWSKCNDAENRRLSHCAVDLIVAACANANGTSFHAYTHA